MKRPALPNPWRTGEIFAAAWLTMGVLTLWFAVDVITGVTYILTGAVFYMQARSYENTHKAYRLMRESNDELVAANRRLMATIEAGVGAAVADARSVIPVEMSNPN